MKKLERITITGLAGFLIAYFCYQVAYGVEMKVGPKGTMTVDDMPPLQISSHNNTALVLKGCELLGFSKSLCLKGMQPLIPHQPIWSNPCDNGICCPSNFPNCD